MPLEQKIEKSKKACQNLISTAWFQNASVIMIYLSLREEVDTSKAILRAWQMGKTVVVPKILWQQKHMIPVEITSLKTGFTTGASGLRNPTVTVPIPFGDIDLVVTPGLGFDSKGNRLGRGGSFYDRFFANAELKAKRCGFAFAEQLVDVVPVADYDEPVDLLVTDSGILDFER